VLLSNGANANAAGSFVTLTSNGANANAAGSFVTLTSNGANANAAGSFGAPLYKGLGSVKVERGSPFQEALDKALRDGNTEILKLLLSNGANVNAAGSFSPLYKAVHSGKVEIVTLLLEYGANVNVANQYGTALHTAVRSGNVEIVTLLLEYGADVNEKDCVGSSPLQIAEKRELIDCAKLINKAIIFDDLKPQTVEFLLDNITPEQLSMLQGRASHKYATSFQAKDMRAEIKKFNDIMSHASKDKQQILNEIFYDFIETIFGHQALKSFGSKVPTLQVEAALQIWEHPEDFDCAGIPRSLSAFLSNPFAPSKLHDTPQVLKVAGDVSPDQEVLP
jgi:hypothetical protein